MFFKIVHGEGDADSPLRTAEVGPSADNCPCHDTDWITPKILEILDGFPLIELMEGVYEIPEGKSDDHLRQYFAKHGFKELAKRRSRSRPKVADR